MLTLEEQLTKVIDDSGCTYQQAVEVLSILLLTYRALLDDDET